MDLAGIPGESFGTTRGASTSQSGAKLQGFGELLKKKNRGFAASLDSSGAAFGFFQEEGRTLTVLRIREF